MAHNIFMPNAQYSVKYLSSPFNEMDGRSRHIGSTSGVFNAAIAGAFLLLKGFKFPQLTAFCSVVSEKGVVSEVIDMENAATTISIYNPKSGALQVSIVCTDKSNGDLLQMEALPNVVGRAKSISFSNMLAVYLPIVANCITEAKSFFAPMVDAAMRFGKGESIQEKNCLYEISEIVRSAIEDKSIKLSPLGSGVIRKVSLEDVKSGAYSSGRVLLGTSHTFSAFGDPRKMSAVKAKFSAYTSQLSWTHEEEMLIPDFSDDFIVPEPILKIARRFVNTLNDKRPMVQFMWRGATSIGKSTGVECLAAILHTPLLKVTCHPTMETQDFLADFVPDTDKGITGYLPSFEEIASSPSLTYEKLTGIKDENATSQMCLEVYGKTVASTSGTPRFKFVESNYVKALSRGYICEIQEASRIRNTGTLVGLNEYDRPGSIIPLVDGSYRKRHKNAIVILTDNKGYASCRPIDPSVLRRMSLIIDSGDLERSELLNRVKYNTGCDNDRLLNKIHKIYNKIVEYCKSNDLMDEGSVSATEFEMWVRCIMMDGEDDIKGSVRECVINKATYDTEIQEMIMNTVVEPNLI